MDIGIYILSVIFLYFVARRRGIKLLSLYWIFVAFQCLYNFIPWIASFQDLQFFTLLTDRDVIDTQLCLAASANLCFGTVFLKFYKDVPMARFSDPGTPQKRRNFVLMVLPLFLLTWLLCFKYGWNALSIGMVTGDVVPNPGGMYALAIDAKLLYLGIYLYYMYRFGIDKWAWTLLLGDLAILAVDGARTTFLPITLVTLMVYSAQTTAKRRTRLYFFAAAGLLISIGARVMFLSGNAGLLSMIIPITVEGTMGAYPSLQSIYAIQHHLNNGYTYGASYIVDPIVWIGMPHGELRENIQFFAPWTRNISNGLAETFAPAGGFYYISEAVAAFSYAGPAIVTTFFAAFLVCLERIKGKYPLFYTTAASTIGIMFVKFVFAGLFKMFLIELTVAYTLLAVQQTRVFLGKSSLMPAFLLPMIGSNEP